MAKIPRPKERTATAAELAEDRRRCLAAKAKSPAKAAPALEPAAETQGNLCACLVTFAAWRPCCVCGSLTLFVNPQARTDGDFECGRCQGIREDLAQRLRPAPVQGANLHLARPSLPLRAALHLRSLFSTANDNDREARL